MMEDKGSPEDPMWLAPGKGPGVIMSSVSQFGAVLQAGQVTGYWSASSRSPYLETFSSSWKQATSSTCKEMGNGFSSANIFLDFTPFCESHIPIYSQACCGDFARQIPGEITELMLV